MINLLRSMIIKYSGILCAIGTIGATVVSNGCRYLWYQPEEPETVGQLLRK